MIIDSHCHMISPNIALAMGITPKRLDDMDKEWKKHTIQEYTNEWLSEMDKYKVEKTVFMSTIANNKDFIEFINSSNRFVGFSKVNPLKPDHMTDLKKDIDNGLKGVKLYATNDGFDVSCIDCYPLYEYCEKKHLPIEIHFGVTIGGKSDLHYGNPVMLSRVLKDFPNVNFIIAHFGAGYFRELLMLKYKSDNLYVDTSGTNNWIDHQDIPFKLKDVFAKSIKVFSPKNIIFGTDTRIFPKGYRINILKEQLNILKDLDIKRNDIEDIMYDNIKRIVSI